MIQNIQDNQANLQAELAAIKRAQASHPDNNKFEPQQSKDKKHYLQSPQKVRFALEPTDSEEDKRYRGNKQHDDLGVQVSPYSPVRQKEYPRSYEDLDAIIPGRDNGGDKKDVGKRNPYSNIAVNDSINKKYDFLRSESTKRDSSSTKHGLEMDYAKKNLAATDGFDYKFKQKSYGDDLDLDKRKSTYDLPKDTQKTTDVGSSMNFKRTDYQNSAIQPSWSKADYLGTIDAVLQQAKAKNAEDIEK